MRCLRLCLGLLAIFIALGAVCLWAPPMWRKPSTQLFVLDKGSSTRQVASHLARAGLILHPTFFIALAHVRGVTHRLQAGQYRLSPRQSLWSLQSTLSQGAVAIYRFTLVEGWNMHQIRASLAQLPLQHQLATTSERQLMRRLGYLNERAEGRFFPATYYFKAQDSDLSLLRQADRAMQRYLAHAWRGRAKHLPYRTPYQALILASLIEKETKWEDERPKVARVLINRLKRGMRLQLDSTVLYATGKRRLARLHRADFLRHSAYNTYRHHGLPPTPIAVPGVAAIEAALHPFVSEDLYFIAKRGHNLFFKRFLAQRRALSQTSR